MNFCASTSAESEEAVSVTQCSHCLTLRLPPIGQREGGRQEKQVGISRKRVTSRGNELKCKVGPKNCFSEIRGQGNPSSSSIELFNTCVPHFWQIIKNRYSLWTNKMSECKEESALNWMNDHHG